MNKTIIRDIFEGDSHVEYSVGEHEELTLVLILSGDNKDVTAKVHLVGAGAKADILGFVVGKGSHMLALHTLQEHTAPETTSNLLVKGVLSDAAKFSYDGGIKVERKAQKTDAYQRNENLLLSKTASAESKPALEILANDVRCTHGATVGMVPKEQLWYLATRGVPKDQAERLIVTGFLHSALEKIQSDDARREVEKKLWQIL
ncbi:SufD family Fe-S cluster assembly protein [Candidatus Gottesmanbacteria bacterium]|nr:SufD family Fe-S cluster assembly protein [Candidatus Gottesmanbacteria bacterium]